jgi:hypothetical protein
MLFRQGRMTERRLRMIGCTLKLVKYSAGTLAAVATMYLPTEVFIHSFTGNGWDCIPTRRGKVLLFGH